jgi:hypothetical protein
MDDVLIWRDNSEIVGCSAHRAAGARPAGRPGGGGRPAGRLGGRPGDWAAAGSRTADNQEAQIGIERLYESSHFIG